MDSVWRTTTISATIAARGARFGLITIASALAAPAAALPRRVPVSAPTSATVQHALTGMSLIGISSHVRNGGLVAMSDAAATAGHGPASLRASRNVTQTRIAADSGTTTYSASRPPTARAAAMSSGSPAGYVGTCEPAVGPGV